MLAILEKTDILKTSVDNNLITCGVFLDFSKAFDTVNHEIHLRKLHKYGIRGKPLDWFTSYLTNRSQYVKLGNVESIGFSRLSVEFLRDQPLDHYYFFFT